MKLWNQLARFLVLKMAWTKPENPKIEAYYGGTSGSIFEHEVGGELPGIIR